jgi:hypothetical protein
MTLFSNSGSRAVQRVLRVCCCLSLACCTSSRGNHEVEGIWASETFLPGFPAWTGCGDCEVTLVPALTIVDSAEGPVLGEWSAVAMNSRGEFIASSSDGSRLIQYGPSGKKLGWFGRPGTGPGEFLGVGPIFFGAADTLFVPTSDGRVIVFDPEMRYIRETPTALPCQQSLPSGDLLCAGSRSDSGVAQPFHLISPRGDTRRSFGRLADDTACVYCRSYLVLASAGSEQFWAMTARDYRLMRWDMSNGAATILHVGSSWLPGPVVVAAPGSPQKPSGRIWGLAVAGDAQSVIVFGSAPLETAAPNHPVGPQVRPRDRSVELAGDYGSIVDVVHPDYGVIARGRFPGARLLSLGGAFAATLDHVASGFVRLHIWRLDFQLPQLQ